MIPPSTGVFISLFNFYYSDTFGLTGLSTFVGAAFSRDKRWQPVATAIFTAKSRSHQAKAVFLQ